MTAKKRTHSLGAALLAGVLLAGALVPPSVSHAAAIETEDTSEAFLFAEENTYSDYYDQYADEARPATPIALRGGDYAARSSADLYAGSYGTDEDLRENVLIWDRADGSVRYDFTVPETGIYCLALSYFPMEASTITTELSLSLDGVCPYATASRLTLPKRYVRANESQTDARGNQIHPTLTQEGAWMTRFFEDVDGLFHDPLIFYLTQGEHSLTLTGGKANLAIESLTFCQPDLVPTYESVRPAQSEIDATPSALIRIEGEDAACQSDLTLSPCADTSSYLVSPADPTKLRYNIIGGTTWKKATQTITWELSVPADGWYQLGIKAKQQEMRGLYSNRRLRIDDQVPCEELDQIRFFYDTDWQLVTPRTADGEPIFVHLTAGEVHTLSLEVIPGEIGESMRRLDAIIRDLNTCYRQILMITGPNPDRYTDYNVAQKVDTLLADFTRLKAELEEVQTQIEALGGTKGSEASSLGRMVLVLEKCLARPDRIPQYLPQIKELIASISGWMREYRDQPLAIDYIELASADRDFASVKESLLPKLRFGWQAFCGSFTEDYTNLSAETDNEDALTVWVHLGRDQAQIVRQLTDSEFTTQTGIPVNVNLVVGGIIEASLAGKQPDIALFVGGEFPVNLAARGMLTDLTQFSDYEEVAGWFQENASVQYAYEGGVYGLPVSQNWPMLFYRKDILAQLGYSEPPDTWQALIDMLPALQRRYLGTGLLLPPANVSPATEAGHTFALLTLQNGIGYYNDTQTKTTFDDIRAVRAFETWTEFYTKYKFEQTFDSFTRFRTGLYPLVISNYVFCNQLQVAAPEISGLWGMTSVPGTPQADGSISHAANSAGTASIVFESAKNKEAAWEYLKWFSSKETQIAYATGIEGLMGQLGRFDAANTEAFTELSWSAAERDALLTQRAELTEIPVLPSSYAVTRDLMNAFRETVNNPGTNPRDTLLWYQRDMDEEIARKRENLGLTE